MPIPGGLARPISFLHSDPLHPYSAILHPLTPLRWLLYVASAVVGWGAVVPLILLSAFISWVLQRMLHVLDIICSPQRTWSGDADVHSSTAQWTAVDEHAMRLHPADPQDRIWMVPRGSSAAMPFAPGTSPSSVIHAVLTFSRSITLQTLQARARRCMRAGGELERMRWRAVHQRITRRFLPRWFGGRTDQLCWLQHLDDVAALDFTQHVRLIPHAEWLSSDSVSGWPSSPISAPQHLLHWPLLTDSLGGDGSVSDREILQAAQGQLPKIAPVNHANVLRTARLQAYLSQLSSTPLRPNQPLWELLLLEADPSDSADNEEAPCFVIFRVSHAVADGVLLSGLILQTFIGGGLEGVQQGGTEANAGFRDASNSHPKSIDVIPPSSCCDRFAHVVSVVFMWYYLIVKGPYLLLHKSFQRDDDNALTRGRDSEAVAHVPKYVCWSLTPIPLAVAKRVSRHLGVSLNDLLMAIWLDVLDEYLFAVESFKCERNPPAPTRMFSIIPFNVRPSKDRPPPSVDREVHRGQEGNGLSCTHARALGNKFAVLLVDLPMGSALSDASTVHRRSIAVSTSISQSSPDEHRSLVLDNGESGGHGLTPPLVSSSSFASSSFMRRLQSLSSYMTLLKTSSFEPVLMYGILSLLLTSLPQSVAVYFLDLYAGLASVVLTNNRSADARLVFKTDDVSHPTPSTYLDWWVSWAPQRSDAGICVTLLTYAGQLRVSIVAEQRCLQYASCAQLVQRFEHKITALVALTR